MVSSGRWLFESEAKRNCGVNRSGFCEVPGGEANRQASPPARCQPWTIRYSLPLFPSRSTPYGGPSSTFFPEAAKPPAASSSLGGFSACRMIMILVVAGFFAMVLPCKGVRRLGTGSR